jgi:FHA domain
MRIEVQIADKSSVFYDLNQPKLSVGSHPSCEIIIKHPTISRRHLTIINENDKFFIIDQGSTNGTFINDQKLQPGQRVEFNSFFPVRLGVSVFMSLVSEVEENEQTSAPLNSSGSSALGVDSTATNVISMRKLKSAPTVASSRLKKSHTTQDAPPPPIKRSRVTWFHAIGLWIILLALFLNNPFENNHEEQRAQEVKANADGTVTSSSDERPQTGAGVDIIAEYSPLVARAFGLSEKCQTPREKFLCQKLITGPELPWGIVENSKNIVFILAIDSFLPEATDLLTPDVINSGFEERPTVASVRPEDIYLIASTLALVDALSAETDLSDFFNHKFIFGFYIHKEGTPKMISIVEIPPQRLLGLKSTLSRRNLSFVKKFGVKHLDFTQQYYQMKLEKSSI